VWVGLLLTLEYEEAVGFFVFGSWFKLAAAYTSVGISIYL
jgi:hypothetical protein